MDRREAIKAFLVATAGLGISTGELQAIETSINRSAATPSMMRMAYWVCDLDGWKWPDDWGEPPGWIVEKFKRTGRDQYEFQKDRYHRICNGLESICGTREVLRVHNVVRRGAMTEAEFSEWYSTNYRRET